MPEEAVMINLGLQSSILIGVHVEQILKNNWMYDTYSCTSKHGKSSLES
jgi:hypothetical protein